MFAGGAPQARHANQGLVGLSGRAPKLVGVSLLRHRRTKGSAKLALKFSAGLVAFYAVLIGQALWARKKIGTTKERPPHGNTVYGVDSPGEPIRALLIGDSTAVGYGVKKREQTPAAQLAEGLSHVLDTPISMRSEAVVGASSIDLLDQIEAAVDHKPEMAFILVGANDIRRQVRPSIAAARLGVAVRTLRETGAEVVVGTVPDMGTIKVILPPLRNVVRHWSRRLARAQTVAAVDAGARVVSVGDLMGPLFIKLGDGFFGEDRFHPSAAGYANVCGHLVSAAVASWRERDNEEAHAELYGSIMSVPAAAQEAADHSGTEVVRRGRLARVLPRRKATASS